MGASAYQAARPRAVTFTASGVTFAGAVARTNGRECPGSSCEEANPQIRIWRGRLAVPVVREA